MLESINIHSSVAVYVQIENEVQFAVASRRLKGGDQLPPILELAERLQVNPNTVAKAYRDLEVMGYVYTRRGMGVFLEKGVEAKCREECQRRIIARTHEVIAEAKAAGMDPKEIKALADKSYDSDAGPYGSAPQALLALAKGKKRSK